MNDKVKAPDKCPACRHHLHKSECEVPLPWWRRWIMPTCRCIYWDARWEADRSASTGEGSK